jgi:hypothetical protein
VKGWTICELVVELNRRMNAEGDALGCIVTPYSNEQLANRNGYGMVRKKTVPERWRNPKLSRRTCTCEYGLHLCRGKPAGVAKQLRVSDLPPEIPNVTIRNSYFRCTTERAGRSHPRTF